MMIERISVFVRMNNIIKDNISTFTIKDYNKIIKYNIVFLI